MHFWLEVHSSLVGGIPHEVGEVLRILFDSKVLVSLLPSLQLRR